MTDDEIEAAQFELDLKRSDLEGAESRVKDCKAAIFTAGGLCSSLKVALTSMRKSPIVLMSEFANVKSQYERSQVVIRDCRANLLVLEKEVKDLKKQIDTDERSLQMALAGISSTDTAGQVLEFKNGSIRRDQEEDFE